MPSVYFDGDKRRIYEVPDAPSSYVVDGSGYRIYTPDDNRDHEFVSLDFQPDIWSDFQTWHQDNEWSTIAFGRTGGAERSAGEFATNDYTVLTSDGWEFVPADYPHTLEIFGNVLSDQDGVSIFDPTRITSAGVFAYVRMADSLQVIQTAGGLTTQEAGMLLALYKSHFNRRRWDKVNNTIILYDDDGITPLQVFDTNNDMSEITPQ